MPAESQPMYANSGRMDKQASEPYTIQPGDTLSGIAKSRNTTVADIVKANPSIKDPNHINAGAKINFNTPVSPAPAAIAPQARAAAPVLSKPTPQPSSASEYDWDAQARFTGNWEGFRNKLYTDSEGHPTIGYGLKLNEPHIQANLRKYGIDPNHLNNGGTLEEPIARKLMVDGLRQAQQDARTWLGEGHFDTLPLPAQQVYTDMSYNLGLPKLQKFKDTRTAVLSKDWSKAAKEMENSKWYRQTKRRGVGNVGIIRNLDQPLIKQNSVAEPPLPERPTPDIVGPALRTTAMLASVPVVINALGHASQRFIPAEHRELIRASGAVASSPFVYGGRDHAISAFFIPTGMREGGGKLQQGLSRTIAPGIIAYKKDGWNADGILAHELGHMMNYRDGKDFSSYGKGLPESGILSLAAGGAHLAAHSDAAKKLMKKAPDRIPAKVIASVARKRFLIPAAIAAAIPFAPTLQEETSASHRGGKLMVEHTGNPLSYLQAFVGLPSYYAFPLGGGGLAAQPYISKFFDENLTSEKVAHFVKRILRRGR